MPQQPFPSYFFTPHHIILMGASERAFSLGERILSSLLTTPFQGKITPVNLRHPSIAGLQTYSALSKIKEEADLLIAVTPTKSYESLFKACLKKQLHNIILIQDWDELSEDDIQTAANILEKYRNSSLNISVCNPAGVHIPTQGLNASLLEDFPAGYLALVTGNANVSKQISNILHDMKQGVSRHISMDYKLNPTSVATWINRFGQQRHTRAALVHYNPHENQRQLFSAIRHFTRHTPLILHCTDYINPKDKAIFQCLSRHCQFIPTFNHQELTAALHALLSPQKPSNTLHILANAPMQWLQETADTVDIQLIMPSEKNNIQQGYIGSNPTPTRFRRLSNHYLQQETTQSLLAIVVPNSDHQNSALSRVLALQQEQTGKNLLISSPTAHGLMQFQQPETAILALGIQNQLHKLKQYLQEIPPQKSSQLKQPNCTHWVSLWEKQKFTQLARNLHLPEYQAQNYSQQNRFEFTQHPQFGMVLTAQFQGQIYAVLPPFTTLDIEYILQFTHLHSHRQAITQAIHTLNILVNQSYQGQITIHVSGSQLYTDFMPSEKKQKKPHTPAIDFLNSKREAAAEFLRTHSETAAELLAQKPEIPAQAENVFAPYPSNYPVQLTLKNKQTVTIRPFEPEDAQAKQNFVRRLSPQSRYTRFMTQTNELSPITLARLSKLDYLIEGAWIAENSDGIVGISRISRLSITECEFGITLAENMRGSGLGQELMQLIIQLATQQGYQTISAEILKSNIAMQKLAEKSGFTLELSEQDSDLYIARYSLQPIQETNKHKFPQ